MLTSLPGSRPGHRHTCLGRTACWPLSPPPGSALHRKEDVEGGDRLNGLTLPVDDMRWTRRRADKGGFIQEATGWKPNVLQPFVYLPLLLHARL